MNCFLPRKLQDTKKHKDVIEVIVDYLSFRVSSSRCVLVAIKLTMLFLLSIGAATLNFEP